MGCNPLVFFLLSLPKLLLKQEFVLTQEQGGLCPPSPVTYVQVFPSELLCCSLCHPEGKCFNCRDLGNAVW